jgi:hypothetical protein
MAKSNFYEKLMQKEHGTIVKPVNAAEAKAKAKADAEAKAKADKDK